VINIAFCTCRFNLKMNDVRLAAFIAIVWNQERTADLVGRRKENEQRARRSSTATTTNQVR
jgi:hypothetical protein